MIDGVPSRPFSAMTLPPIPKPEVSYANEIIEYSRKTYSTPRAEVEKAIAAATGVEEVPSADKSEDRAMFDAVCVSCKKDIKVPFKPDPARPVYCKDCFAEMKLKPVRSTSRPAKPARRSGGAMEDKKQRKSVDVEGLKKILEDTFPKK